jgi:hypothetical protein
MKHEIRQKKRQAMSNRSMRQEKKEIRLMHERFVLNNFERYHDNQEMYNRMMCDDFNKDSLLNSEKKVYNSCKKFIMFNDYKNLKELEKERDRLKSELEIEQDEYEISDLRKKVKELSKECSEFKKKLTEESEDRRNYNLCVAIDNMSKYN